MNDATEFTVAKDHQLRLVVIAACNDIATDMKTYNGNAFACLQRIRRANAALQELERRQAGAAPKQP